MANYNKVFPAISQEFEGIYTAYKGELIGLINVLRSNKKSDYLSKMSDYNDFKKTITKKYYRKRIGKLTKGSSVINVWQQSEILTDALLTSHLAICCELLDGVRVTFSELNPANIDYFLEKILGKYKQFEEGSAELNVLNSKLHSIDAFRTIQILKALGLYTKDSKDVAQLSLGVGSGSKDLESVHLEPALKMPSDNVIEFYVNKLNAKDVILVDGDPQRKELFDKLCNNKSYPIIALNDNAFDALSKIPEIISMRNLEQRNVVMALRIDHRMIPDVKQFFRLIANNIDNIADLIITIGSGFDIDDFRGRTTVIKKMFDFLKMLGLHPVLLKLHGSGTLEEQWNNHAFGLKGNTTYQILHCKLKRNILKKID